MQATRVRSRGEGAREGVSAEGVTIGLSFRKIEVPTEIDAAVNWLTSNEWPFHVNATLTPERARELVSGGSAGADEEAYWIDDDGDRVGIVRLLDLGDVEDGNPVFDLRIASGHRRRGYGKTAVLWLTRELFTRYPHLMRISATTRDDNSAMRRVLEVSGYVMEGRFRNAWRGAASRLHDSLEYSILRGDWESGTTTPVRWDGTQGDSKRSGIPPQPG